MKATLPDGTVFEGTTEEYLAIRNEPVITNDHKAPLKASNSPAVWNEKKAREFWNSLDVWNNSGLQKQVLEFLIKNGGRASEKEVWEHLGVKGQALAGVLANITRNARRETKRDDVRAITWMFDGKHDCYYLIPEELLQYLNQLVRS